MAAHLWRQGWSLDETDVTVYREELTKSLSLARNIAAETIWKAQEKYKMQYDRKTKLDRYRIGEWVLIKFLWEESGKQKSCQGHGMVHTG